MAETDEDKAALAEGNLYKSWSGKIADALKREKKYRRDGARCVRLYEGQLAEETPFAILYSNTETLAPAVYNSRPIPVVDRRFKDADPVGKLAAETGTRVLKFLIEAESEDYDNFDELMQPAVLGCLTTNRGLTRFKYEADTSTGEVKAECVYGEDVRWDKFFHGHARTWKKVPWIGFEWDMSKEELRENFSSEIADKINLDKEPDGWEEEKPTSTETKEELSGVKLAKVYEIWDKISKKVMFFSPSYSQGVLKVVEDPLQLSGFFPVPKPLNFMRKVSTLVPTPLYIQYEQQAKELNDITTRLKYLIKALKVRGFYNSTIEGIDKLLTADDNELVPAENMASMPDGSGVDRMIWIMPLADLATTVQNLYQQREQVKNVIYEITGISDILRGASIASETATAQNIKNQWGTLRLKKLQKEVQRYCRDSLRIMLEIAVTKFSVETMAAMTGLPYPTQAIKQQAQMKVQMAQQQAAMAPPQIDPQTGQPAPPQPPQIPPEVQQVLQSPSWEDVLALLKNDTLRAYRVDIETNSTIDAEASQDKQDISELLNAISQFLNGIAPLIENGSMPFDVAKGILLAIARRYTFGPQLEDSIQQMKAPEPQPDPAAQAKQAESQAKLQQMQAQGQRDQQKAQTDQQSAQLDLQIKQQEMQLRQQEMQMELEMKQLELAMKREEMGMNMQMKREEMAMNQKNLTMKGQAAEHSHNLKMQMAEQKAKEPKKEPA